MSELKTAHSDILESLQVSMGLLQAMDSMPGAYTNPVWKMVYHKAADQSEWLMESSKNMWTDEENKYIEESYDTLTWIGMEALDET